MADGPGGYRDQLNRGDSEATVVLLSGGLDSSVLYGHAFDQGFYPYSLFIDHDQRNVDYELKAARHVVKHYGGPSIQIVRLGNLWGDKYPLTSSQPSLARTSPQDQRHIVPLRNPVFAAMAVAYAVAVEASSVLLGFNMVAPGEFLAEDGDASPNYLEGLTEVLQQVGGQGVVIKAPLGDMTQTEILKLGVKLKVPVRKTYSCFEGKREQCRQCKACVGRIAAFNEVFGEDE